MPSTRCWSFCCCGADRRGLAERDGGGIVRSAPDACGIGGLGGGAQGRVEHVFRSAGVSVTSATRKVAEAQGREAERKTGSRIRSRLHADLDYSSIP